ncbi:DUF4148 domain-containing protein [Burkholderia multivorans]|uniref:DUF4148 domain-containing protein n=1 Tax=Burkholderia multivorans TaxID=87883 RepID=UPI001C225F8C|nr:DUF4148 domain-containing protein [Burkholderia multivorans]MBU9477658.1 DUF4148 domain-containing protein [Burkholderia multivorans]
MKQCNRLVVIIFAAAGLVLGSASTFGQAPASEGSVSAPATSAKLTKAQRKAARKEARAKKNAELKKLEGAGYDPGRENANYPQGVQDAQKKVGPPNGARQ